MVYYLRLFPQGSATRAVNQLRAFRLGIGQDSGTVVVKGNNPWRFLRSPVEQKKIDHTKTEALITRAYSELPDWHDLIPIDDFAKALPRALFALKQYPHTAGLVAHSPELWHSFLFLQCLAGDLKRKINDDALMADHPQRVTEAILDFCYKVYRKYPSISDTIFFLHHDTLEDLQITFNKFKHLFGQKVAELVSSVTIPESIRDNKDENKKQKQKTEFKMASVGIYGFAQILLKGFDGYDVLRSYRSNIVTRKLKIPEQGKHSIPWFGSNIARRYEFNEALNEKAPEITTDSWSNLQQSNGTYFANASKLLFADAAEQLLKCLRKESSVNGNGIALPEGLEANIKSLDQPHIWTNLQYLKKPSPPESRFHQMLSSFVPSTSVLAF